MNVKTLTFQKARQQLTFPDQGRNLFSSAEWMSVIDETYGLNLFVKYIEDEGRIRSYVLYSVVRNFLEWKICVCSYCDYCDGMVASLEDWQAIFESLREDYPDYRIAIRNHKDPFVKDVPGLKLLSREWHHQLDISPSEEDCWRKTTDSFRAAVRQAQRNGVTVRTGTREDLKTFYEMHQQVRKYKYHLFAQPFRFFESIWNEYMARDKGVLLCAVNAQGKIIAVNVYLICGDTMYYKFNTSHREGLKLRPNNLLFWEGVKMARDRGLSFIDLGSSGFEQKGLVLYKNQTGAEKGTIHHYGFAPPGYKFSQKRILRFWTWLCTRPWVPDRVTRWGSHLIYPYLA